jgi:phage/plasmid primase-like uncharacterized protein
MSYFSGFNDISTGASIFAATNTPTFCARSCSNLKNVAQALRQNYPDCAITIFRVDLHIGLKPFWKTI